MVAKTFLSGRNPNQTAGAAYPGMDLANAELVSAYVAHHAQDYAGQNIYVLSSEHRYLYAIKYFLGRYPGSRSDVALFDKVPEKDSIIFLVQDKDKGARDIYNSAEYAWLDSAAVGDYAVLTFRKL